MADIFSAIAVPLSGVITYVLGHIAGAKKEAARVDFLKLNNYQKVVDFYKNTFDDLQNEINLLHKEILKLSEENKMLKEEINKLNEFLKNKT